MPLEDSRIVRSSLSWRGGEKRFASPAGSPWGRIGSGPFGLSGMLRLMRAIIGETPPWRTFSRSEEGTGVSFALRAASKADLRLLIAAYTRFGLLWCVCLALVYLSMRLAGLARIGGGEFAGFLAILFSLAVGVNAVWAWFESGVEIEIHVHEDRIDCRFASGLFRRQRSWSRDQISAIRWSGHRSIKILGAGGKVIGRILFPTRVHDSTVVGLARAVRIQFGF